MAQSETNRAKVRYSRETAWGETVNGPATTELRITSEGLQHEKQTVVSQEIRSDRQRADVLEVGQAASGPVNFELSWSDFETFFETALRGAIVSTVEAVVSTTFTSTTITGAVGADYTPFEVGQWFRINANGYARDNAVARVVSRSSTVITFTGTTLVAGVASCNVVGRTLKNGTTKSSFFIETDFDDLTAVKYFNGARIDSMALNIQSAQIVTGVFNFQAKRGFTASTSQASTTASAGSNTPLTAAVNVLTLRENDTLLSPGVAGITINLANNMRQRPQVGSKTTANPGDGGIDITGQLNAFFEDISLYNKMIGHTASDLTIPLKDANNNQIIISIPAIHFAAGDPTIPGQDQDVFLPLDFLGFRDSVTNTTIRIDFLPI